jgi:hypothetical protein
VASWSADWVEAIGTWVAAFGAVGAWMWQARGLRQERRARREDIARVERESWAEYQSQAAGLVLESPTFRREDVDTGIDDPLQLRETGPITCVEVRLRNVSNVAFHGISVHVRLDPLIGGEFLPDNPHLASDFLTSRLPAVCTSGQTLVVTINTREWKLVPRDSSTQMEIMSQFEFALGYSDPKGGIWHRRLTWSEDFYMTTPELARVEGIIDPFNT